MAVRQKVSLDELNFTSEEEKQRWKKLKSKNKNELKDGKYLYELLRLGLSPILIDNMLDIRTSTIEKRCIEYLKTKDDNYDDFNFLFKNCYGLPTIELVNRYLNSALDQDMFCKNECIKPKILQTKLKYFEDVIYVKEKMKLKPKSSKDCGILGPKYTSVKYAYARIVNGGFRRL